VAQDPRLAPVLEKAGMPALRRITVTITYTVGQLRPPPYVLVTYISSYS